MTYVNSMSERRVFDALRSWLVRQRFGYRSLFWITGVLSFFLSAAFDNLTTALLMCAVILAVGRDAPKFVSIGCVNIVVAANAGGAFSPFGDITTLMVWQRGVVDFLTFFNLFVPSVVNYLVPAVFMSLAVQRGLPAADELRIPMKRGDIQPFDSFREVARAEWDTLLFFFGVIMCVGGLGFIGYLAHLSTFTYLELGPTLANGIVGVLSAVVDNIPVMVAVLQMQPQMDVQQWLLVTLAAGVGGSMLSIWVHLLVNARFAGVMP